MKHTRPYIPPLDIEATVSSKGQVTLPKAIRDLLGIHTGSRIRFSQTASGGFQGEPVRFTLADLWSCADARPRPQKTMTLEQMDQAKARRIW